MVRLKMDFLKKFNPFRMGVPRLKSKLRKGENAHQSLRSCIILAQVFGIFPIQGVLEDDPRKLKFRWKSFNVIYSILMLCGLFFLLMINFIIAITTTVCLFKIINVLFYTFSFLEAIMFFHLSVTWPKLMRHWIRVDEKMKNYGYPKKLDLKVKLTMIILLFIASIEYSLALIHNATHYNGVSITFQSWEFFMKKQFAQVFTLIEYSLWKSIILLIVNTTATFLWSYADLFVMMCSFVLAARFKQITERLDKVDFQVKNELLWRSIREDYDRLAQLCRHLDDTISNVLLLSYSSNLSFIIYQLFNSIKKLFPLEKTYFYFSFSFLIARTIALSLYGASINDESKEPIRILNSVPSSAYNGEIKRFLLHLKMDAVALTGHKLFKLTRGFILSVAATIVTYELVLIQFNQATLGKYRNNETQDICYT